MEGDIIKKLALLLCLIAVVGMFAGCSRTITHDNPFAIYNDYENMQVAIGDKRADVEKLLGPDEMHIVDFEEDNIERVAYWDNENVYVDYSKETNRALAMRFDGGNWSILNGLKVGDSVDAVKKQYPADMIHKFPTSSDLYIGYDKDGNVTKFGDDVPFSVRFKITDGKVATIIVQDSSARPNVY